MVGTEVNGTKIRSVCKSFNCFEYYKQRSGFFQRSGRLQRHLAVVLMMAKRQVGSGRDACSTINGSSPWYKCPGKSVFCFPKGEARISLICLFFFSFFLFFFTFFLLSLDYIRSTGPACVAVNKENRLLIVCVPLMGFFLFVYR